MAPTFVPAVGMTAYYKKDEVRLVACYTTDFGNDQAFLCQKMVDGKREEWDQANLKFVQVPCKVPMESIIWAKDLSEKPTTEK